MGNVETKKLEPQRTSGKSVLKRTVGCIAVLSTIKLKS